jgi:purine nucleosidase
MKLHLPILALSILLALALLSAPAALRAEPVKIIFDTDITGDVDDVLALAMCHTLADRGACELLGVTVSKNHPLTARFVDAQNTYYGRPGLPVGVTRDDAAQHRESRFLELAESPRYPHALRSNDEAHDAVELIRELLAAQPDGSVVIVSVGIASNLANLLKSPGGPELVSQKVKTLSIMAGAFAFCNGTNYHLEANVVNGIGYMQTVADEWPEEVPIVWSGFEIGEALPFPRIVVQRDFDYLPHHLVKEAYLLHSGPEHDRPSWDQSSVLHAVHPDRGYFGLSPAGRVTVLDDGFTRFVPARNRSEASRRDRFLTMTPEQRSRALEAIVQLVVQPPQR